MQFGMPTLIEFKTLEACAALCRELGLAFIEINMNLPIYQAERVDITEFRRISDKYGIYYTIHLDENLNPFDFNKKVAAAYIETTVQTIETAKKLNVPILNMHLNSGVWFTLPERKVFLFNEYEHEYIDKLTAYRDLCEKSIGDADIKICVENCGDYEGKPYIRKGLALLLESPVFAVTFDVGHNAGAGYTDEPTIMQHIDQLCHMHIHDASGQSNHLTLGSGEVDLPQYLELSKKHHCRIVIEVKTMDGLRLSVDWLKERGYL